MIQKIESGPAEIITSGTVIGFSRNPITITFGSSNETLKIIFEFKDEEGKEDIRVESSIVDPQTLKFILINFKNPLGTGSPAPMPFGSLDGRQIYLHYRVYPLGAGDKMLHYSIYKGEEVSKNG